MKKITINNSVTDRLRAGINIFHGISVTGMPGLKEFIRSEHSALAASHLKELPPGFQWSRKLYRSFSTDPTKHRPSSEALWRRTKKGLEFPEVNPYVDLTNLLSLKYQVPYGLYDLDLVKGEIEIARGGEGDSYQGIRKDMINLNGKLLLRDEEGPFGNPSADSLRTCTTGETPRLLQVIFFHKDDPLAEEILSGSHRVMTSICRVEESESYLL